MFKTKEAKLLGYSILVMFIPFILSIVTHETQNAWCVHFFNENHTAFFDQFFKYATNLGDGLILIPFLFLLLYVKKEYWSVLVMASAIHGIIVYLVKEQLLKGSQFALRPAGLHGADAFNQILDVHLHTIDTFPSGHTTTGFVITGMLIVLFPNWKGVLSGMIFGFIVAISRMYLGQHFLVDVSAGAIVGLATVLVSWVIAYKKNWLRLKPWEKVTQ
ncbi:phosphatase PAP2 family protein [Flammeovirga kamogawensis]|uniref:Phosphatase PAP2 family protein n=1 Tax=Flammeovirga kamogawensis TaxID=373891 RepID=A0ABX8GUD8_9BACT|nr:phosphatase PAP2 family protein [Flammeovirga kamogawensis]MBB6460105.1 membrane-associated phospholipid phosphatase [Flammeovirga kamogawensis]QWG06852.1 phosphatase PAP2 family protein [Flammeovirga kamogawensis]TRX68674.1 phosphatase PAP2 family protein [Flammeovirga kamogawensis]